MRTNPGERETILDRKLHRIRKDLMKLERNSQPAHPIKLVHPTKETVVCPFDPYHIIDKSYLDRHVVNCASSSNVIKKDPDEKPAGVVPLESYADVIVPVMKDWEEEEVTTYDPYINTQRRNVMRYLVLVPKSQKKHFRRNERLRIQVLETAERNGPHKEINNMLKNLRPESICEMLVMYMRRLDIECCETIIDNFDFEKLVISNSSTNVIKEEGSEPDERVINIPVDKLFNNSHNFTAARRGSVSDLITSQFGSLGLSVPQDQSIFQG